MANWEKDYVDEWKAYVRARAYENALYVAAANRVGEDVTMGFGGESMIVGPRGRTYAALDTEAEVRKDLVKEQQELLRELQALRESKAALEAAKEVQAAKETAKKEAEAAKKDGVTLPPPAIPNPIAEMVAPLVNAAELPAAAGTTSGTVSVPPAADAKPAETPKADAKPKDEKETKAPEKAPEKHSESSKKTPPAPPKKPEAAEGYCVARIDLDEVRHYREEFQTIQARQPTVYKAIVRRY